MSDIDTSKVDISKVGKEISNPNINERIAAWNTLASAIHGADPAQIKSKADQVTSQMSSADLHALGLDGFHLDQSNPLDTMKISAADADKIAAKIHQTPDHKEHQLPYFNFTDGTKTIALLPQGVEFDPNTGNALRGPDVAATADPPLTTAAPADASPTKAAPADAPLVTAPADAPPAGGANLDATTHLSAADQSKLQQFIQKKVNDESLSVPVKKGEGYYQVIRRMNPDMKPEDAVKAARHMRDLNGGNVSLKVGDKLPLMSDADKTAQVQQAMGDFAKLSPDDQAKTLAAARAAFPDAPAAPAAPATPAETPPETPPVVPTTAAETPPAVPRDPSAPPADATPVVTPAPSNWVPTLDPTSKSLQPHGDAKKPEDLLYNPLAPIGLSEGTPGQALKSETAGVKDRQVQAGKDSNTETITGKLDNWGLLHWADTTFTTKDTMQNGKLATRDTVYDNDRVTMKFQGAVGQPPIEIQGVKEVNTALSKNGAGYDTTVTDSTGKVWIFKSDENGVVTEAHAKSSS